MRRKHMRLLAVSALLILFLTVLGCSSHRAPEPAANPGIASRSPSGWDDEFDGGSLDAKWSWVRENPAKWSLTAVPGQMRIIVEAGELLHNPGDTKNLLLQTPPGGDWTIVTKLTGKPTANWAQAGLIVYQDDNNWLKMVRLYCDGNTFQFGKEVGGTWTEQRTADNIASQTSYLKIVKSGNSYSGFYSADDVNYTQVWTAQTVSLTNIKIGLVACNGAVTGGPTMNADFDWFHLLSADDQAPTVPAGLAATAVSETRIDLSWTASTDNVGVAGYKIFRDGGQIDTTTNTTYSDTGLAPGTTYTYTVSAYDAAGNESAQSAPAGAATPALPPDSYDDEFAGGTLDAKWSWVRENPAKWSLGARPGFMRIIVEAGDLNHNPADNKNLLLQTAPAGDWTINARLDGKPAANWAQAGVIVYQDDNNYLKMAREYISGNKFQLAREIGGVYSSSMVADNIASTVCYLRIEKSGNNYRGYYSADGVNYTQVWTAQTLNFTNLKVGLVACNGYVSGGPTMNADFDYFRVDGDSPPEPDLQAPTVPTGLSATAVSSSQINLSWTASTDNVGVAGYRIFRDGGQIDTVTGTAYSDTGLSPGTTYTYRVSAYDAAENESAQSSPASATTQAASGFWLSGGSRNTNHQSSTYEWANFRGRPCTFQIVYSTRNAGWGAFVASHGTSGQIADFTDPSIEVMIQTPPFPTGAGCTYASLIAGAYDGYWQQIGTLIKNRELSGKPTIISIAWEMNGTYMYWGGGGGGEHYSSPSQYIQAYRRIVSQLRVTYPQIRTAWVINAHATPAACGTTDAWALYPGDDYVTYVGIDNYDMYPRSLTKAEFDNTANANGGLYWLANHAAQHGKQIIVGEWGINNNPTDVANGHAGGDNANFIQWMYETFQAWHASGLLYAEYYFADPLGGGNVDSDLIGGNPNSRARYISLW